MNLLALVISEGGPTQICRACLVELPLNAVNFPAWTKYPSGFVPWCRPCHRAREALQKQIRRANREAALAAPRPFVLVGGRMRCRRCGGQAYGEDGEIWCAACGEWLSAPAAPASLVRLPVADQEDDALTG